MNAKAKSKGLLDTSRRQRVRLQLLRPEAQQVCIAGSFNDWRPDATPMVRLKDRDGLWAKELVLPPGRYEYRFVVDGQWVDDPAAKELIPNVFGTANAVLEVPVPAALPSGSGTEKNSPRRSGTSARKELPLSFSPGAVNTAVAVREKFPSLALMRFPERY